jgi:hypothetical protein
MHKNATKCNETLSKWCKNKHGASKIMDTFETYQAASQESCQRSCDKPAAGSSEKQKACPTAVAPPT